MNKIINISLLLLLVVFITFRINTALGELQKEESDEPAIPGLPKTYSGMLPCTDCPGILFYFQIKEESFTELNWYLEIDPDPVVVTGTWSLKGDTLFAYPENEEYKTAFLYRDDLLILLDRDLQQVTGTVGEHYKMKRIESEKSIRNRYAGLKKEGIEFIASGNEPFWSMRVDSGESILFITPGDSLRASPLQVRNTDSLTTYTAVAKSGVIRLHVQEEYCIDSMSGFLFTHTVTAETGGIDTLYGCGIMLE